MAAERRSPGAEMPFLDHLEELRRRLFYCAAAFLAGLGVAYLLFTQIPGFDLITFLSRPIAPYLRGGGGRLIYTHPGEAFQIVINAAVAVALVVASPVILYQLWAFVSPAMYRHEKRVVLPVLLGIVVLFVAGVALAFTLILPLTLRFLVNVESSSLTPMISAGEYFGFAINMSLAFGLAFELPIVVMGLAALGLVTPMSLARFRRWAIVGGLVAGGFITPDPTSMFAIAAPLYLLYELSIVLSRVVYRWRLGRQAGDTVIDATAGTGVGADVPRRDEPRRLGSPA